ncbi:MAG: recombinase family protein [Desulfobacterales bacterium]|nr:recombinase family protein [Desulfobacterales bacterium]
MDDFLYNLRTGRTKQQYNKPNNRGSNDWRNGNHKKKSYDGNRSDNASETQIAGALPEIKTLLESLVTTGNRRIEIEERKTVALESIAVSLKNFNGLNLPASVEGGLTGKSSNDKGKIVQMVKALRKKGETYDQIANFLEKENIPTFSGRGKWHAQTIHKICREAEK